MAESILGARYHRGEHTFPITVYLTASDLSPELALLLISCAALSELLPDSEPLPL